MLGNIHCSLDRLSLAHCKGVTSPAITTILVNSPYITYLNLDSCKDISNGTFVVPLPLEHVRYLNLNRTSVVADISYVVHFLARLSSLISLKIDNCGIQGALLAEIVTCWPNLEEIHITASLGVNYVALKTISQSCPRLRVMNLSQCVTDEGLKALAEAKLPLKKLMLSGCIITDAGLFDLIRVLPCLEWLDISACKRISRRVAQELTSYCPRFKHIVYLNCPLLRGIQFPPGVRLSPAPKRVRARNSTRDARAEER